MYGPGAGGVHRGGYPAGEDIIFEDLFQRGPASDWGAAWGNYDAASGDWTIDANNIAAIRCEAFNGNRGYNIPNNLSIAAGRSFFVEAYFKSTTATFFGAGGITIWDGVSFGCDYGVEKQGGTNFVHHTFGWVTGGTGLPTNFTDKVLRLVINAAGTVITAFIDGVAVGTFAGITPNPTYKVAMFFHNLSGGNQMITQWKYFRVGYP